MTFNEAILHIWSFLTPKLFATGSQNTEPIAIDRENLCLAEKFRQTQVTRIRTTEISRRLADCLQLHTVRELRDNCLVGGRCDALDFVLTPKLSEGVRSKPVAFGLVTVDALEMNSAA
jgi:hypothetical protein